MKINTCVVQDFPIFFDKSATLKKVLEVVEEAALRGSNLIVFPESFIPGYPRGFDFGTRIGSRTEEGRRLYQSFYTNSIDLAGEEIKVLEGASRDHGMYIVIGISERVKHHGSLYCTMVYISPRDGLLGYHRKIKPTGSERIIWAESDGSTLSTFDTEIGRMGGLICWENYMPLARMAMYQKGIQLYIAPTADSRDSWTISMQHIALEGRCFVLSSNQYFTKDLIPEQYQKYVTKEPYEMCRGGSVVVGPDGKIIAGPLFGQPGILEVEIDLTQPVRSKLDFDPVGHYNREDIFKFEVYKQPPIIQETKKSKK